MKNLKIIDVDYEKELKTKDEKYKQLQDWADDERQLNSDLIIKNDNLQDQLDLEVIRNTNFELKVKRLAKENNELKFIEIKNRDGIIGALQKDIGMLQGFNAELKMENRELRTELENIINVNKIEKEDK